MIALLPLIGVAGAIIAKVTTAGGKILSAAYSKANVMSAQTIKNMRTVASFQVNQGAIVLLVSSLLAYSTN